VFGSAGIGNIIFKMISILKIMLSTFITIQSNTNMLIRPLNGSNQVSRIMWLTDCMTAIGGP